MVLFDELMGAIEVGSYNRISDPTLSGLPPDGIDTHVSEGALRGASYVQPALEVRALPWAKVQVGGVIAWSTAPIQEPFNSYRAGGTPTNHLGEATTGYRLGTELDWAIELEPDNVSWAEYLQPSLRIQGGHLQASEDLGGETLHLLIATGRVRW